MHPLQGQQPTLLGRSFLNFSCPNTLLQTTPAFMSWTLHTTPKARTLALSFWYLASSSLLVFAWYSSSVFFASLNHSEVKQFRHFTSLNSRWISVSAVWNYHQCWKRHDQRNIGCVVLHIAVHSPHLHQDQRPGWTGVDQTCDRGKREGQKEPGRFSHRNPQQYSWKRALPVVLSNCIRERNTTNKNIRALYRQPAGAVRCAVQFLCENGFEVRVTFIPCRPTVLVKCSWVQGQRQLNTSHVVVLGSILHFQDFVVDGAQLAERNRFQLHLMKQTWNMLIRE